jgi:hypothetical protein
MGALAKQPRKGSAPNILAAGRAAGFPVTHVKSPPFMLDAAPIGVPIGGWVERGDQQHGYRGDEVGEVR